MRLMMVLLMLLCAAPKLAAQPELRGHGGPVRAIAVAPDGKLALTGSFDQSAMLWSLERGVALAVLRVHEGAVNAVAALPDGRFASAAEDGRIALWAPADVSKPQKVLEVHGGPIVALAAAADAAAIASASWDSTLRVTQLADGASRAFSGHQGNVNGVAFSPDGRTLLSAGYDASLRLWPLDGATPRIVRLNAPLNALAVSSRGEVAAGGSDGSVFLLTPEGELVATIAAADAPIIALAFSPDGAQLAAASPRGAVAILDVAQRRQAFTLNGPGLPVWSLAYTRDGRQLLTGGGDRIVRRWDARTGDHLGPVVIERGADVLAGLDGSRGADVFKACAVCHTLTPGDGQRAGPSLHGIIGRRIGTSPGYAYSKDFAKHDIVWTKETIARLFEIGPQAYTPGTKMPEQRVGAADDRAALVDFIEKSTR